VPPPALVGAFSDLLFVHTLSKGSNDDERAYREWCRSVIANLVAGRAWHYSERSPGSAESAYVNTPSSTVSPIRRRLSRGRSSARLAITTTSAWLEQDTIVLERL
jgi:hypothetical protein